MATSVPVSGVSSVLVVVRPEPPGQHTAEVVGIPELRATATERGEAIAGVQAMVQQWLAAGRLDTVAVSAGFPRPWMKWDGPLDPNDPLEQEFLEELARNRREDLERTLQEDDDGCSGSSSTPTT